MNRIRRAIAARPLPRALLVAVLALALVGQVVAQPGPCCPNVADAAVASVPHHPAQTQELAGRDAGGCHGQDASVGGHTDTGDVPVPGDSCDAQCLAACAGGVVALPASLLVVDRSAPASHAAVSVPMSEAPLALRALRPPITG